ncbi:MAG: lipopolysaccharide heptosyltransferase I [Piscinibacter sp.]|nr:lipopolysaccharide heptosyltransferase I [Piscinibacter sp.]
MRILIVKLSSLGDVVHAMPVVHDIRSAFPDAAIDWVVEPAFAPLVRRVDGVRTVIECAMRRWRRGWWSGAVRAQWRTFREQLQAQEYDAVVDLQGLTKSALVARLARGMSFGLANRTDGSSYEAPARWLVDRPVRVEPHIHAMDRSRALVAAVLGRPVEGPPVYGLRPARRVYRTAQPTVALVHGTSRDDKLWPVEHWVALGKRLIGADWRVGLPQGNDEEQTRAELIAAGLQYEKAFHVEVWPSMSLDAMLDRLALTQGVIGVDSGLSHLAVALDLPHVQLYNHPTAWRTGPLESHGHRHQLAVEARPQPSLEAVWSAWNAVLRVAHA